MTLKDPGSAARTKQWRKNNPDKVRKQIQSRYARPSYQRYMRDYHLQLKYGMSHEDYERMLVDQEGLCRVCKRPDLNCRLAVDHDHTTRKVRGLLCGMCNKALGLLGEDPLRILALLNYVYSWGGYDRVD
mgnify:CR=1 FL=1